LTVLRLRPTPWLPGLLLVLSACAGSPQHEPRSDDPPVFRHDVTGPVTPWTNSDFDDEEGKFTFALFSDLTGGERDGVFDVGC
jgi:hypothetical protein